MPRQTARSSLPTRPTAVSGCSSSARRGRGSAASSCRAGPRPRHARQPVAQRHRHAAVHRAIGAHQPARDRRSHDRVRAGWHARPHHRPPAAHRARGRSRAPPGAERRDPAGGSRGGFWFVFLAGTPAFSRFDANGVLLFHRVMQGQRDRPAGGGDPDVWPRRAIDGAEIPLVSPLVRTAAVDRAGRLWVSFVVPVHLRLRRPGREGAHGAVPGRRDRLAEQPPLPRPRAAAGHARLLRVRCPLIVAGRLSRHPSRSV